MIKPDLKPHLLMVFAVALAAGSFPIGALITHELPPAVLMFFRFFVAALCFAPYVIYKQGWSLPSYGRLWVYAFLSLPPVIFFWCMFESLRYTSALNTGALYSLVPAITALYAWIINKEDVTALRVIGLLLGILGALWIVFRGDAHKLISLSFNYGDVIFIIGCLFTSLQSPLVKRFYQQEPMSVMTFWMLLFGAAWLLLLSIPYFEQVSWENISNNVYAGIVYMAVFSTLLTFLIRQMVVVEIGATRVSIYGLLAPVFVIIMSLILGLNDFDNSAVFGVLLIILSITIVQKSAVINLKEVPENVR